MTRTVYVKSPKLWKDAADHAADNGIGLSVLVERALASYLMAESEPFKRHCVTCALIRSLLEGRKQ